jgi:16S rRNA (uracil1498-N3)-methyltransferase
MVNGPQLFWKRLDMRRYWISNDSVDGDVIRITGDVLHHLRDVCRQNLHSKFELILEGGTAHLVEIISESKHESVARVLETRQIKALPEPHIHLAMSIPRFPVFEAVVEKAVELGVATIHPFFSEFSFIRKQADTWEKKLPRFSKIVQSATQQSGRGDKMEIAPVLDLNDLIAEFKSRKQAAGLFAYEGEAVLSAREGLTQITQRQPREIWAFIGSEGGFSTSEVNLFKGLGLQSVTLGSQVLRVETACVATVSIIKYDFDLMR